MHLIWQVQEGYLRETVQQNFLKYISQTIIRDLEKNHPKVLERFLVNTKDSKYKIWQRRTLRSCNEIKFTKFCLLYNSIHHETHLVSC